MFSFVNSKIEVRNAGPKGKGLFAKKFIQKEEMVVNFQGKIVKANLIDTSTYKNVYDYCFQIEKNLYICPEESDINNIDKAFYFNHSCEPNCGVKGQVTFIAMRDIQPKEEITFDYAMTDNLDFRMKCFCRSHNCRKIITGNDWINKNLQKNIGVIFQNIYKK